MEIVTAPLPGVLLIRTHVFRDHRGSFLETWHRERYSDVGIPEDFVQDNAAFSVGGVLRGLHYQYPEPQGKLITVLHGEVYDVAVDIRTGSPQFGKWFGARLSADRGDQMWIPEGFAHGYLVLSDIALFSYKCTRRYRPEYDAAIRYDDPSIGVVWPEDNPTLSAKDAAAPKLVDISATALPCMTGLGLEYG